MTTANWGLWCCRCQQQITRREKSERRLVRLNGERSIVVMHTECPDQDRVIEYDESIHLQQTAPTVNSRLPMKVPK
jgi:hypothetical protein